MSTDEELTARAKSLGDDLKKACRAFAAANDEPGTPFSRRWLDAWEECQRLCIEFGRVLERRDQLPVK